MIDSTKKQAGAELKNKKGSFLGKNSDKPWVERPKIDQFPKKNKKNDISGQKNKLGQSLRRKKGFLGQKLGKNLRIRSKNYDKPWV